jgi:hypothetical protein
VNASIEKRPTSEDYPRSQGLATTVWRSKLSSMVETHYMKSADRRALGRWMAPGARHLRRLLYCVGRALRPGEPDRELASALVGFLITNSPLYHSEFARMDPGLALGITPDDLPRRVAIATFRARTSEVIHRSAMTIDPPIRALIEDVRDEASRIDVTPPLGKFYWAQLIRCWMRLAERSGTNEALPAVITATRDRLDVIGLPRLRARLAAAAFDLWEKVGDDVPLDATNRAWVLDVLEGSADLVDEMGLRDGAPINRILVRRLESAGPSARGQ